MQLTCNIETIICCILCIDTRIELIEHLLTVFIIRRLYVKTIFALINVFKDFIQSQ
jgi:hypothetical protein